MAAQMNVMCQTSGCHNFGIELTVDIADAPWSVICGPCGTILAQSD